MITKNIKTIIKLALKSHRHLIFFKDIKLFKVYQH